DFITAQIDAVFSDLDVNAVKIGMLSRTATIEAIAKGLDRHRARNIVLDPVMVATSGDRLLSADAIEAMRALLIPRALVVTPNLPEAAALLEHAPAHLEREMEEQARAVLGLGAQSVLIKGGHGDGPESIDLLVDAASVTRFAAARIATPNTHGSGCTLSSAIAAGLAKGLDLKAAVRDAKTYVTAAIATADALRIGRGYGPLHHFHELWRKP